MLHGIFQSIMVASEPPIGTQWTSQYAAWSFKDASLRERYPTTEAMSCWWASWAWYSGVGKLVCWMHELKRDLLRPELLHHLFNLNHLATLILREKKPNSKYSPSQGSQVYSSISTEETLRGSYYIEEGKDAGQGNEIAPFLPSAPGSLPPHFTLVRKYGRLAFEAFLILVNVGLVTWIIIKPETPTPLLQRQRESGKLLAQWCQFPLWNYVWNVCWHLLWTVPGWTIGIPKSTKAVLLVLHQKLLQAT